MALLPKRRRLLLATAVVVALIGGLWWLSRPQIDPRLAGSWKVTHPGQPGFENFAETWTLGTNGVALMPHGETLSWWVGNNELFLGFTKFEALARMDEVSIANLRSIFRSQPGFAFSDVRENSFRLQQGRSLMNFERLPGSTITSIPRTNRPASKSAL
jgi:hypothetical protein